LRKIPAFILFNRNLMLAQFAQYAFGFHRDTLLIGG
jgi:hypothetical protein